MTRACIRRLLGRLERLFGQGGWLHEHMLQKAKEVLAGDDDRLLGFLVSNELRGRAGSIPDEAFLDDERARRRLTRAMMRLGELQSRLGWVKVRREMWLSVLREWRW